MVCQFHLKWLPTAGRGLAYSGTGSRFEQTGDGRQRRKRSSDEPSFRKMILTTLDVDVRENK